MTWEVISGALTNVWAIVTSCITFIVSNDLFLVLLAGGLVPLGFKVFRVARRSVK